MPRTHDTVAGSIGATRSTFQAVVALRASGGAARAVADQALLHWQRRLAARGLWVDPSAAAALAGVHQLASDGAIGPRATVVVVLTAGGLKDPASMAGTQGELPVVRPQLDAAREALRAVYGFEA